MFHVFRNGKFK